MGEGKRESSVGPKKAKGKFPGTTQDQKGKGKGGGVWPHLRSNSIGNQTARTNARTKRNGFPVEHPPTSDSCPRQCPG